MRFFLIVFISFQTISLVAHPSGNIVTVNAYILWSYVYPVGDIEHHACIMIWDQKSEPRPYLISEFPASDFILFSKNDYLYIIESRYINSTHKFESRILKTKLDDELQVIWPWYEDKWKIGNNGFFMDSDTRIIFGNYPNVYKMEKDEKAAVYFEINDNINRIKLVEKNKILLLSDKNCWLTDAQGNILKSWKNLPQAGLENLPMNRNNIFDADFKNGQLLIAYWGKRSFEIIDTNNKRKILKQYNPPWVPHWVAFYKNMPLLFASQMDFNNSFNDDKTLSTIVPNFLMYNNGKLIEIWTDKY